jgi:hypothetical protein
MDTKPKTVSLTYMQGDWSAIMEVCAEPKTDLEGCGDNVADALEDLASEIRLAEGKVDAEDEHPDGDTNVDVPGASEA